MILFAYGHQSLQVMHYVILWIVLSRMSIQPAHAHRGKRDGMTKSSAWGICAPLRARLWRQEHGLYPASPAGLVLRSRLVGIDLHACRHFWKDYRLTGTNCSSAKCARSNCLTLGVHSIEFQQKSYSVN